MITLICVELVSPGYARAPLFNLGPHMASEINIYTHTHAQKSHSQPKMLVCRGLKVFSLPLLQHLYLARAALLVQVMVLELS